MKYTREQIAENFQLWQEYVDPASTMTEGEFNSMTLEQKLEIQAKCFGDADTSEAFSENE